MPEPLYTLSYFSRNAMKYQDGGKLTHEVRAILQTSRRNNAERGITGALLYSAGCFAQVLEGPLSQVETIVERIMLDPRHHEVKVLQFHVLVERAFGDWSMAFAGVDPDASDRARIDGTRAEPENIMAGPDGLNFIAVMRDLIARHELYGM